MAKPVVYPVKKLVRMKQEAVDAIETFATEHKLSFTEATRLLLNDHLIGLGYIDNFKDTED